MNIYEKLNITSNVTIIILSVGLMLACGFFMTRLTKLIKLPNVTAYVITGILLGPFVLKLIPQNIIDGMEFLSDIALAFIAFGTGEFFKLSILKKNGGRVLVITLFESLFSSLVIFLVVFFILRLDIILSLVLAALAATTSPSSTLMTIRQTNSKGEFVDTLLPIIALDDIVSLLAFSIAISVATFKTTDSFSIISIVQPILVNIGVITMGGLFGVIMRLLMTQKRSTDNRLIIAVALLFAFCGICSLLNISPLLGCMSMGTVYMNISNDDKLFKQLNYFSPPILLLFFVRAGLNLKLDILVNQSAMIGGLSLLVIGIIYLFVRIIGKYGGAFLGCLVTKRNKLVRNYLGLALVPQAGLAIGLAALGARAIQGDAGNALETIIIISSVFCELIGPICAKSALYFSRSYSNKLEDITDVTPVTDGDKIKTPIEILIERINRIQEQLPKHEEMLNEEENAFTEAAEEYYQNNNRRGFINRRR